VTDGASHRDTQLYVGARKRENCVVRYIYDVDIFTKNKSPAGLGFGSFLIMFHSPAVMGVLGILGFL